MPDGDVNEFRNQQRLDALAIANRRRAERKELKQLLKQGEPDALDLIGARLPEWEEKIAGWTLRQLLMATPGVGEVLTGEILRVFRASPTTKVSAFSYERREQLAKLVAQATNRSWP